jgi:plastocyanin
MKRIVRATVAASFVLAVPAAAPAGADSRPAEIEFGSNFFTPAHAGPVDVRQFGLESVWVTSGPNADHNVREDSRLFRSGAPGKGHEFREEISAGSWHYYCEVHGSILGGMDGTIDVRPVVSHRDGHSALVRWADNDSESGDRYEVEWRVKDKRWQTWKESTVEQKLEFGGSGSPVAADPDRTYEVRARSFAADHPSRRSGLSPAVAFTVK